MSRGMYRAGLLFDVKRMIEAEPYDEDGACVFCYNDDAHTVDCPWDGTMTDVADVLEAAHEVIQAALQEEPSRTLYPGHPLSDLALALYGKPTAIVVEARR